MRRVSRLSLSCAIALLAIHSTAFAQTGFVNMVDHVHLAAPDQAKAVEWYQKYFGGKAMPEGPDRLMFGETRLIFQRNEMPQPSAGSVLDHVGFSVANLDATMTQLAAAGVKVTTPAREVQGLFKLAFVEDPWGTRIEIVQDPQKAGLHHVHLRGPDPAATLAWFTDKIGGKVDKLKGQIDGIQYADVWLLVQRGEAVPSAGHAFDHIGFRPVKVDDSVAGLKTKNVKVTSEPRDLTLASGTKMRIAFIEGLDGVRIELVQR